MIAADLLTLAAELPTPTADKLAHALGWPDCYSLERGGHARHTVRWADPYRNYYAASGTDADWLAAEALGLARVVDDPREGFPYTTWTVTHLGQRVIRLRLRLEATRAAFKLAEVST